MTRALSDIESSREWVRSFTGFDTPRLHVRPLAATDDIHLFEAMQDPRVNQWIGGFEQPFSLVSARRWLAPRLERMERGDGVYVGVFYKNTDVLMGFAYAVLDGDSSGVEIAGALNELYWGKGFVEEFSFALISDLFAAGVSAVLATSAMENWSSVRVLRALNFTEVATKPIITPNGPRESRVFRLTAEAWRRAVIVPLADDADPREIKRRRVALVTLLRELKEARRVGRDIPPHV